MSLSNFGKFQHNYLLILIFYGEYSLQIDNLAID